MKIKGLLLMGAVVAMLASCTQTRVGNVELVTMEDSLAYAIGISTYRGITDAGWEIDPMLMARAMQDAKEAQQYRLAKQFDAVYNRVKQKEITQDDQYKKDMQRLEHLQKLYDITQEFPV